MLSTSMPQQRQEGTISREEKAAYLLRAASSPVCEADVQVGMKNKCPDNATKTIRKHPPYRRNRKQAFSLQKKKLATFTKGIV